MIKKLNLALVFIISLLLLIAFVSASTSNESNRYIVKVASDVQLDNTLKKNVVDEVKDPVMGGRRQVASAGIGISGSKKLVIKNIDEKELENDESVIYAEPDYIVNALGIETPWNIESLGIDFSQIKTYGQGVKIAVLDTGSNNNYILSGYDFVNEDSDTSDDNGHGTFVSSILKSSELELPLIDTEVYSVKVLNNQGAGYVSDVIEGINWAVDNDIDIVLMSFGGEGDSLFLKEAINEAYENGILFVAAAGNTGEGFIVFPAAYNSVIGVGSVNENLEKSSFSNYGEDLECVAPGENILINNNGKNTLVHGTSFSVPHVGIVATSILSNNPQLDNKELRSILQLTALDLGAKGKDNDYGWGLVNLFTPNEDEIVFDNLNFDLDDYPISTAKSLSDFYPSGIIEGKTIAEYSEGNIKVKIIEFSSSDEVVNFVKKSVHQGVSLNYDGDEPYFEFENVYGWIGGNYAVQIQGLDSFDYDNDLILSLIDSYSMDSELMIEASNISEDEDFVALAVCSDFGYNSCSNSNDEKREGNIRYECNYQGFLFTVPLCWEPVAQNGDSDFCTSGAPCTYEQGDCDFESQCEGTYQSKELSCVGPINGIFGGADDGCCFVGEGYAKSTKSCCTAGPTQILRCSNNDVQRKVITNTCGEQWETIQSCSNTEICKNNACAQKTCVDFGLGYGGCSNEGTSLQNGDVLLTCKDQVLGFGQILCWEPTAQNGDGNYCDALDDVGLSCNWGNYDCDINIDGSSECSAGLVCDDDGQFTGDSVEGCCSPNENWNGEDYICSKAVYGKIYEINQNGQSFVSTPYSNVKLLVFIEDDDLFSDDILYYFSVDSNANGEFDFNPERYISNWNWDTLFVDYKIDRIFAYEGNEIIGMWTNQFSNIDKFRSGRESLHQIVRIHTDKELWQKNEIPNAINGEAEFKANSLDVDSLGTEEEWTFLTWKGKLKVPNKGDYQFAFNVSGDVKLVINNETLIDTKNGLEADKSINLHLGNLENEFYFEFYERPSNYPKILWSSGDEEFSEITEENLEKEDTKVKFINNKNELLHTLAESGPTINGVEIVNKDEDYMVSFIDDTNSISSNYNPLVLVHGLNGDAGYWDMDNTADKLNNYGYSVWEFYYPNNQEIDYSSSLLADSIGYIKSQSGKSKVNVIAHSMGGLVSRGYVAGLATDPNNKDLSYKEDIGKVITLGSPFAGSYAANRIVFDQWFDPTEEIVHYLGGLDTSAPSYKDLAVGSEFTWNLNYANLDPSTPFYTFAGTGDNILPIELLHHEDRELSDSIVSLTSANILYDGATLITYPINHANLKGERAPPQGWLISYNMDDIITVINDILQGSSESTINNHLNINNDEYYIKSNSSFSDNNPFTKGSILIKLTNEENFIGNVKIKNGNNDIDLRRNDHTGIWLHFDGFGDGLSVPIGTYSVFVNGEDTNRDVVIKAGETSINEINLCNPNWVLNGTLTTCDITDNQYRNYYDANACGWGTSPEPINQSCDFCSPNWTEFIQNECLEGDIQIGVFNDANECFAQTGLSSDISNKPENITYNFSCDYNGDGFIGDISNVNTTVQNLSMNKINETYMFKDEGNPLFEFEINLTNSSINFGNLQIEKQNNESNFAYLLIKGIDLTPQNKTKTAYLNKILGGTGLCIKDEEFSSISEVSSECNGENEIWVACPGTNGDYSCNLTLNETQYIITGLKHSGVKEQSTFCGDNICNGAESCSVCSLDCGSCPPSGGGGGGGGGSGGGGGGGSISTVNKQVVNNETIPSDDDNGSEGNETSTPTGENPVQDEPRSVWQRVVNFFRGGSPTSPSITGAVVGAEEGSGGRNSFMLIALVVIVAIAGTLIWHKKRKGNLTEKVKSK